MSTARADRARSVPGDSITGRLLGRAHTRARVGPAPSFYHKFGLPDPMSLGYGGMEADSQLGPGEPATEGPFTFLSSAAYLRSVRQARFRLLGRISAARQVGRVGERLTAGPAFALPELAAADLGMPSLGIPTLSTPMGAPIGRAPSITLPIDELTVLAEPLPAEAPPETLGETGMPGARRRQGEGRVRSRRESPSREPRQAPAAPLQRAARTEASHLGPRLPAPRVRPVARAVTRAREGELARASSSDLRALPEVQPLLDALSSLSRLTRREVAPLIQKVLSNPTPATLAGARKALQTLRTRRGTDAAATRGELGPVERARVDWTSAESGERLSRTDERRETGLRARALGRTAGPGRSRGLTPVLASSPSWVLVEAAEREVPSQTEQSGKTGQTGHIGQTARTQAPSAQAPSAQGPRARAPGLRAQERRVQRPATGSAPLEPAPTVRPLRRALVSELTEAPGARPARARTAQARAVPTARLAARSLQPRLGSSRGLPELERGLGLLAAPELEELFEAPETSGLPGTPHRARPERAAHAARAQAPVRRAAARWAVGRVQESEAAPLSRSTTAWMGRQPTQRPLRPQVEPELLAPTPAPSPSAEETAQTPAPSRTPRPARPTSRPTARAAARMLSSDSARPVAHLRRTRPAPALAESTRTALTRASSVAEPTRTGSTRTGSTRTGSTRTGSTRTGPARTAPVLTGSTRTGSTRTESTRAVPARAERVGPGPARTERTRAEPTHTARTTAGRPVPFDARADAGTEAEWLVPVAPVEPEPLDLMDRTPVSSEPRTQHRLMARGEPAARTDSRGRQLLSEAPVARPASARALDTTDELTWLQPESIDAESIDAEETVAPRATTRPRPGQAERRRPLSAQDTTSELTERVSARQDRRPAADRATGPTPTLLAPELPEGEAPSSRASSTPSSPGPTRPRTRRPSRVGSTVRASRRGLGSLAAPQPSAQDSSALAARPAGRRVAVAVPPTSYLEEPAPREVADAGQPRQIQTRSIRSSSLPTGRSGERAEVAVRLDRLGRALLTPKVVSELRDAVLAVVSSEERQTLRQLGARTSSRWVRTRATQGVVAALRGSGETAQRTRLSSESLAPRSVTTFDLSQLQELVAPQPSASPQARVAEPGEKRTSPRQTVRASARLDAPPVQLDASRWAMGVPLAQRAAPTVDTVLAAGPAEEAAAPAGQRPRPQPARAGQPRARGGEGRRPGELARTSAGRQDGQGTRAQGGQLSSAQARLDQTPQGQTGRTAARPQGVPAQGQSTQGLSTQRQTAQDRPGPVLLSGATPAEELEPSGTPAAQGRTRRPSRAPPYARHAEPALGGPEDTRQTSSRTMAGASLLSALARSGDPEQVVQLVLERTSELSRAARALPDEAQTLIQRIVRGAHQTAAAEPGAQGTRQSGPAAQMLSQGGPVRTITRRVAAAPAAKSLRASPGSSATVTNGAGASQVMKMAGKLMKLIHLAEAERRADAQRQMRMSEAGSTPEHTGPASPSSQVDSTAVEVLQHKVVQAVLDALKQQEMDEGAEGSDVWG
jgi:hypothetical protein